MFYKYLIELMFGEWCGLIIRQKSPEYYSNQFWVAWACWKKIALLEYIKSMNDCKMVTKL